MNRFKLLLSSVLLLHLCFPVNGVAQTAVSAADSIVYNVKLYSELYNDYKIRISDINKGVIEAVAKVVVVEPAELNLNTKFKEDLYLDSLGVIDLVEQVKTELPFYEGEEGDSITTPMTIIGNIVDVVKPKSDSIMLMMTYYPWKAVFDTRSVYRVGLYNDGIGILKGLIEYTCDSIQREIYINELMNVYDVWYEYCDTINASMNETFSKTFIKSEKVRDYIAMYPEMITSENVMQPHFVKMYDFIMDALNEPENQEEVHYMNIDKLMNISVKRLGRNWKKYQEQYAADFEIFDVRMQLLLEHVTHAGHVNNINVSYGGHTKLFDDNSALMDEVSAGADYEKLEEAFALQMLEKSMDEKFLSRVIRKMRGSSDSDVYLEALENYTYLTNVAPEDILAKRRLLTKEYYKRERYDEAIEQISFLVGLREGIDNIEKAEWYYMWGSILELRNDPRAAYRYQSSVKLNPNFGNAYYRLAIIYSNPKNTFTSVKEKDKYRYFLCLDKLERAKECIKQYANSPTLSKYNDARLIEAINKAVASCESNCPPADVIFMLGDQPGTKFTFPAGVMKGESTTLRFY